MKKKHRLLPVLGIGGCLLILAALLASHLLTQWANRTNVSVVAQLERSLPEKSSGSPEDYSDATMPIRQIGGEDYVCLLEVPSMGITLPVSERWRFDTLLVHPARFWGSVYDGSCILGGSSRKGQFDFCARLEMDDEIRITDMQGACFTFRIARIDRSKSVAFDVLADEKYPLTLFVRDQYDFGYILVRCDWAY